MLTDAEALALADDPAPDLVGLCADARARRDAVRGVLTTYSPKVFIPLTMLCRDRCGYCTFAQPPARLESVYLSPEQVLAIARDGARMGCHEALFTLGEAPEERYPVAAKWLAERGYDSTVHYLHDMAALVLRETGLLPHANAGALDETQLRYLAEVSPSQLRRSSAAPLPCVDSCKTRSNCGLRVNTGSSADIPAISCTMKRPSASQYARRFSIAS